MTIVHLHIKKVMSNLRACRDWMPLSLLVLQLLVCLYTNGACFLTVYIKSLAVWEKVLELKCKIRIIVRYNINLILMIQKWCQAGKLMQQWVDFCLGA